MRAGWLIRFNLRSEEESMTPDEQWAKSYVYTSKGLRVLLCPQGSLAVFDCAGRMIEMVPGDFDGTMRNILKRPRPYVTFWVIHKTSKIWR